MRTSLVIVVFGLAGLAAGCKQIECGEGTIERQGSCVPADLSTGNAKCGPFTMVVNDQCVPMFPPTVCDDGTTEPDTDPSTGVTTCHGTGGGGCGAPLACPNPVAGKQTICGQLFDFETNAAFATPDASGMRCTTAATSGPCALSIRAFDAFAFAADPMNATALTVGETYIDDCGRYRIKDITVPGGPFIALGIDDADMAKAGPAGVTNTSGIATPKMADTATKNVEGFVAPKTTTDKWSASGGPPLSGGIYAMVFRANKTGTATMAGVTVTQSGNPIDTARDFYFNASQQTRTDVVASATETGVNGTALVTGARVNPDGLAYSGAATPALPADCTFSTHAGASLPFILFIQVVRPITKIGAQNPCPL